MKSNPEDHLDAAEALEKAVNGLHPGAIYLLNRVSQTSAQIMPDFITAARNQGYTFRLFPADPSFPDT